MEFAEFEILIKVICPSNIILFTGQLIFVAITQYNRLESGVEVSTPALLLD